MARAALLIILPLTLAACAASGGVATGGAAGGAASTGAADQASPRSERRCFQNSQINNFRVDRETTYIKVGRDAVYQLSAAGACMNLDSANSIALVAVDGGSTQCIGDMVTVLAPGALPPTAPCRARIDRQLTADQIAALPERLRP